MKTTVHSALMIFTLFLFLTLTPYAKANGADIVFPITILLLSKAANIHQVNIPESFSWQTSKNLRIEIELVTSDGYGNQAPVTTRTLLAFYTASANETIFSQVLLKRVTDEKGRLELDLTLPTTASRLKVAALTSSRIKPSTVIDISTRDSERVILNLTPLMEGEDRKAADRADW